MGAHLGADFSEVGAHLCPHCPALRPSLNPHSSTAQQSEIAPRMTRSWHISGRTYTPGGQPTPGQPPLAHLHLFVSNPTPRAAGRPVVERDGPGVLDAAAGHAQLERPHRNALADPMHTGQTRAHSDQAGTTRHPRSRPIPRHRHNRKHRRRVPVITFLSGVAPKYWEHRVTDRRIGAT